GEGARAPLAVAVEVADERVGVGVARAPERGGEGAARAEVESARPTPARGLAVQKPLEVSAELVVVIASADREVVGERGADEILPRLAPAVEPVDVGGRAGHARPARGSRNRAEVVVLREELRRGVVQSAPLQALDLARAGYEPFAVMPHAEVEFVDDRGTEYVNPVGRPAVVLIKVVREYPPAVGVAAGPPRRAESEVVRSPPRSEEHTS